MARGRWWRRGLVAAGWCIALGAASPLPAQRGACCAGARVAGRVVDRDTGRPISQVRVTVAGQPAAHTTDLDGRYRTGELPEGVHAVRAQAIG